MGLSTKDKTVKTTRNSSNMPIVELSLLIWIWYLNGIFNNFDKEGHKLIGAGSYEY